MKTWHYKDGRRRYWKIEAFQFYEEGVDEDGSVICQPFKISCSDSDYDDKNAQSVLTGTLELQDVVQVDRLEGIVEEMLRNFTSIGFGMLTGAVEK